MVKIKSYFNPASDRFHAIENFKQLKKGKQIAVTLITIIGGILTLGIGTIPFFRILVGRFHRKDPQQLSRIDLKMLGLSTQKFSSFKKQAINFPEVQIIMNRQSDTTILTFLKKAIAELPIQRFQKILIYYPSPQGPENFFEEGEGHFEHVNFKECENGSVLIIMLAYSKEVNRINQGYINDLPIFQKKLKEYVDMEHQIVHLNEEECDTIRKNKGLPFWLKKKIMGLDGVSNFDSVK